MAGWGDPAGPRDRVESPSPPGPSPPSLGAPRNEVMVLPWRRRLRYSPSRACGHVSWGRGGGSRHPTQHAVRLGSTAHYNTHAAHQWAHVCTHAKTHPMQREGTACGAPRRLPCTPEHSGMGAYERVCVFVTCVRVRVCVWGGGGGWGGGRWPHDARGHTPEAGAASGRLWTRSRSGPPAGFEPPPGAALATAGSRCPRARGACLRRLHQTRHPGTPLR
jgi:hypothetical protein